MSFREVAELVEFRQGHPAKPPMIIQVLSQGAKGQASPFRKTLLFIFLNAWSLPLSLFRIFLPAARADLRFQPALGFGPIRAFRQNATIVSFRLQDREVAAVPELARKPA